MLRYLRLASCSNILLCPLLPPLCASGRPSLCRLFCPHLLPAAFLRAVLGFMRPFFSKKAGRKIKQVQSVHEIAEATGGEVTVQSLGPAFAEEHLAGDDGEGGSP